MSPHAPKRPSGSPSSDAHGADTTSAETVASGMTFIVQQNRRGHRLIMDYTIGVAMVMAVPIPWSGFWLLELKLLIVAILILKMLRSIGRVWGYAKGQGIAALLGNLVGSFNGVLAALALWLILVLIGMVVPHLYSFASTAALALLTWSLGRVTNHYYLDAQQLDKAAIARIINAQRSPQR